MRPVVLVLLATLLVTGAEDKKKTDKDLIKGKWTIVSLERDGKKNDDAAGGTITFDEDTMNIQLKERQLKGTFKLDPTKKPTQIDITPSDGADKDKALPGIYSLKDDELRICVAHGDKARPTEFKADEGSDCSLVVLKKEK